MTEQDWLSCTDPRPMLRYLREQQASERKMRLLACACCRRIWDRLPDLRSRQAVEVSERFADRRATPRELGQALAGAVKAASGVSYAAYWAASKKPSGPTEHVFMAASTPFREASRHSAAEWDAEQEAENRRQVALIREVMGNPFRPATLEPAWLAWGGNLVRHLAEDVYEDRAFERMGVLGDALEDAGCTEEAVLAHCRQGGEHVRGCWVLDLILGRN